MALPTYLQPWDPHGESWTISKELASCSRKITMPAHHHSIFTGQMLFLMPDQQLLKT